MSDKEDVPRKPGRPKAAAPLVPITGWVTHIVYDRLTSIASAHAQSVSAVVRDTLTRRVKPPEDQNPLTRPKD
jgi:hypothetical protein